MPKRGNAQELLRIVSDAGELHNLVDNHNLLVKAAQPLATDYKIFSPTPFTNGSTLKKSAIFFSFIGLAGLLGDILTHVLSYNWLHWSGDLLTGGLVGLTIVLLFLLIEATDKASRREIWINKEAIYRSEKGSILASAWLKDLKFINRASAEMNMKWDVYYFRGHDGGVELVLSTRYWRNKDIEEIASYLKIPFWDGKKRQLMPRVVVPEEV